MAGKGQKWLLCAAAGPKVIHSAKTHALNSKADGFKASDH
jgi:hypothetical protein